MLDFLFLMYLHKYVNVKMTERQELHTGNMLT